MPKTSPSLSTYTTMMRVNSKGRPYAKDLNDLFSALLIQQPLTDHRSLFRNYPSTFTTDEAVHSLGRLQFTHLVSTPNPLDPSNPILTRTTTTFSMSRDMAKTLGQHFLNARLAENATDPQNRSMKDRGIWSPTPKGRFMIQDFSQRARVDISHIQPHLNRIPNFQIVQFERLLDDDQLSFSRPNMLQAFKVMMEWLPTQNLMIDDIGGVKGFEGIESYRDSFYGYQCFEWIMEYTGVVSNDEAESVAAEFVLYGWIQQVLDKSDKDLNRKDDYILFKTGRKIQYYLTDRGRRVLGGDTLAQLHLEGGVSMAHSRSKVYSSASSSSGSMMTRSSSISKNVSPLTKASSNREQHSSRLLPTTEESELPNDGNGAVIVPQAVITKQRTISKLYDSAVAMERDATTPAPSVISESILQIENSSCDFGFSSSSSTSSTIATAALPESIHVDNLSNRHAVVNNSNETIVQEQLEKLKVASNCQLVDTCLNSQNSRLQSILRDPLIRMYFRQFLKSNFCEENINFWVDYTALVKKMSQSINEHKGADDTLDEQSEVHLLPTDVTEPLLAHCCVLYNTYFCPQNAPHELNIDHGLRHDIVDYMQATFIPSSSVKNIQKKESRPALGVDAPFCSISVSSYGLLTSSVAKYGGSVDTSSVMRKGIKDSPQTCLHRIRHLYDLANDHVCKTMAQDSVPRFMKTEKYQEAIKNYDKKYHHFEEEEVEDQDSADTNNSI